MTSRSLIRRPEGVGFVTIFILSVPFMFLASEVSPGTRDWLFVLFFFITFLMVNLIARVVFFIWKGDLKGGVEKVEYYTF